MARQLVAYPALKLRSPVLSGPSFRCYHCVRRRFPTCTPENTEHENTERLDKHDVIAGPQQIPRNTRLHDSASLPKLLQRLPLKML
jgi:hypothetical protein